MPVTNCKRLRLAYLYVFYFGHGREVDIVLLNDTGIQTVEVHDEDVFVPQAALRFEDETTLVLVLLVL